MRTNKDIDKLCKHLRYKIVDIRYNIVDIRYKSMSSDNIGDFYPI